MKTNKKINIMIHPVKNRKGNYVAYFKSEFLNATFSVFFQDTITGALALHTFSEIIRKKYEEKEVDFILSEEQVPFRSEALLNVVNRQPSFFTGSLFLHRFDWGSFPPPWRTKALASMPGLLCLL